MINVGDNNISGVYLGDEELSVYIGDELIYPLNFGTLTAITLDNLTWVTDISWEGGTGTSANCSFDITGYYDSGKTRKLNRYAVVDGEITASSTTSSTRDLVGTLVLTATCSGFTATGSVDAYQEAYLNFTSRPLTFEILSSGNVNWCSNNYSTTSRTIQYRKNGGSWSSITSSQAGVNISVVTGDILEFRGDNSTYSDASKRFGMFGDGKTTARFKAYGNIMSLIDSTNYANVKSFSGTYNFRAMFYNCSTLTDASNLVLPATALTTGCYRYLFLECSSLTTAPELPASTLANESYYNMFGNCRSLNYIKCLTTDRTAYECTLNWVQNVAASGTFVKKAGYTEWSSGNNGIPIGWTVLEE